MNFSEVMISLCEGFGITCLIFILTLVLSLPLGLIITFGSMSKIKPLRYVTRTFVWIIRGTPLLLQIIIIFYGPGLWFDVSLKNFRFTAVIIAFVINYACYFSEIYRGGIESIPKGQYEGCYVLGMSKSQTFFKVILPQVIKRILPSISNEVITLVKDTSLARVIAVVELVQIAEELMTFYGAISPLLYTGIFYLAFSGVLTILFNKIEKKLDYYKV
ncbi:MAG: amino acid ABC transporter permease [Bacilli bacterium]|nr:amino acid ABC transporter permease [Bacilli bacterium]